jgi:hypothetical protein
VCEDQSWPSILLEIGFFTCSLSKREIDLERGALCTREGDFLKRERGELLEDLERRFCTGNGGDFP